ncbi:PREDICTED: protein DMR6-LIKE OXYGENASE 1-like [Prunus mume]|uniref:Protein DMR6-LIKE OXYGENASE 1-like n=1 Tax=Prunus mume TaxID=102107 RepID=A0ABM1LXV8_PRUMU|nr:PREDICTED: protein DMR6-LIKE OXYGENASE 1-like [Prunus mume]
MADTSTAVKSTSQHDVIMITQIPGAKERSEQEFMALATGAGFSGIRYECFVVRVVRVLLNCPVRGVFFGEDVQNHAIEEAVIDNMLKVARESFHLPESERLKCFFDDPLKTTRLSTSFNVKIEEVSSWRDYLRIYCFDGIRILRNYFQRFNHLKFCREDVAEYCRNVKGLAERLLEAILESLGLEKDYMNRALGKHGQHMAINYYPECPQPELTYGLPGHADPNVVTFLLQDDVAGFQVFNNGRWVAVKPMPHTFIVNIGDQMQVSKIKSPFIEPIQ